MSESDEMKIPIGLVPTQVIAEQQLAICSRILSSALFFKMIEFVVGLILVLFYVYLGYTFTSVISLILNVIIVTAFYFLIKRDLKDEDNHKYYIASLLLTASFFIFSSAMPIEPFLKLTQKLLISAVSVAAIIAYLFAQLAGFVYEYVLHLKQSKKH